MTTICQLGPSTMSPIISLNRFWRDEVIERMSRDADRRNALTVSAAV
jgi:NADH:ubiquinone oxidoreductase subunit F (NADH-binding)